MRKTVSKFIEDNAMTQPGDKVLAAVSGGADSICLFHLLYEMKEQLGIELRVMHVHHGLRGEEADRDAAFVEAEAERLHIPCHVVYRDVAGYGAAWGLSVEEAGRILRYQALEEEAKAWGDAKIAVAHHREDQAETILHNLFRGSGLKGMCGMAAVKGAVIRPLLCVGRKEILDYLASQGITYCEDSTNECQDYTRNRLRHTLIPEICKSINAGGVKHIVSAGKLFSQADEYFENLAGQIWDRYGREQKENRRWGIETAILESQPEILKGYIIRKMIGLHTDSMKDITLSHMEQVCSLGKKGTGKRVSLPYGLEAQTEYEMLWIAALVPEGPGMPGEDRGKNREKVKEEKEIQRDFPQVFTVMSGGKEWGFTVKALESGPFTDKKYQKSPENQYTKWFDYDTIENTLSVRTRQTGDYITLKDGKRKTVKAYMIDEKIPRQERDKILLLAEGHHILWIVGYRISEFYKITEHTQQILQVQTDGGEGHGG